MNGEDFDLFQQQRDRWSWSIARGGRKTPGSIGGLTGVV